MTAIDLTDVKGFMGKLLASDTFDDYLILEAVITKANTFTIDGRLNEEYISRMEGNEEPAESQEPRASLQTWGNVRNICFELIKGKVLPVYMKVVLQLPASAVNLVLSRSGAAVSLDTIKGLYLNITYERGELHAVTGMYLSTFTMDKSLEREWDAYAAELLKEYK